MARVIVIGAGVVGVASAWYLARAGFEVSVVDRQPGPAAETSFANGGQIAVSHSEPWANPQAPLKVLKWLMQADAPLLFRPRADWRQAAPYALIIGGALGNAADRIARGHVVDFIQWHWKDYYWPSFNLGDVAIVVGVVGLVLSEGVSARRQRSPGARRAGR